MWILYLTITGTAHLLVTFVYFFWFVYLLQDVINKRTYFKVALGRMQTPDDSYQQHVVYNAETKYIRTLYLFSLNIVEWLALTFFTAAFVYLYLRIGQSCSSISNPGNHCSSHSLQTALLNSSIYSNLIIFGYNLLLLSMTLIASLCNYLTARYAKKSWIKSDRIPYFTTLVLVIMLVAQILTLFCFLTLIVRYVHLVILAIALGVAIQQSRRLRMVIQWVIVDLEISKTDWYSLKKFKEMNKRLKILFTILWLGVGFIFSSMFFGNIQIGTELILQLIFETNKFHSLCTLHNTYLPSYITTVFDLLVNLCCLTGITLVYTPYICSGMFTVSVLFWRRVSGKTGFETHYPNHLTAALI